MLALRDKKILFFAPRFFGYEKYIKEEIEAQGGVVHFYDERNNPSSVEKILYRKIHFLTNCKVNLYYSEICDAEKDFRPDYIFFLNPEAVNKVSLKRLKKAFPNTPIILYMWDSLKNKKVKQLLKFFDYKYSFDYNDCERYGMMFRPLFYLPEYEMQDKEVEYKYDVAFIGTIHGDRAKILHNLKKYCDEHEISYYLYMYIPGSVLLTLRLISDKFLRKFEKKYIYTKPLEKEQVSKILSQSRCVIDINHPRQKGLTMRTFEMIGLRRKIITTNVEVKKYDFYNPVNQIVVSREGAMLSDKEIKEGFLAIPNEISEKYSLKYWVRDVFDLSGQTTDFLGENKE